MRKSNIILSLIFFYSIFIIAIPLIFPGTVIDLSENILSLMVSIVIYLVLFLLGVYYRLEEKNLSTKELSFIAIYSTFAAVARIPFYSLPGIQPCSYLILVVGYVFGPLIGCMIGANVAIISNLILGQGAWTVYQIIAWGFIGVVGGLLNRSQNKTPNKWVLSIIGFVLGFIFGWIMDLWTWMTSTPSLSFNSFLIVGLKSLPFDLAHAIGNFLFLYFFGIKSINILQRHRQRFMIVYENDIIGKEKDIKRKKTELPY
ncbi:ECF transporter S component [Promethearchaeum syntrophicum]|uniref:ECF transporter S component n=1 Tax=Promethearchaeum syntrophicum TaxID=2594042 RepID=A0A5B9DCY6_9ARCH|nr:ECF transporter S component [Candidatus Prometheoarchaeum syntrophicum]QEE17088.1 hypothetical protein DSAG12_02920 [Candidatus Prometheoarchaeum syntrophicum]